MVEYHCFISGLPELFFDSFGGSFGLESFLNEAESVLEPAHFDWVNRLVMVRGHKSVLQKLNDQMVDDIAVLPYSFKWLEPDNDEFKLLPVYLQEFAEKFRRGKDVNTPHQWELVLTEGYYGFLNATGNGFMNSWANFDMDVRNYITSKKCMDDLPQKYLQLVVGNIFARRLLEFSPAHKEIQVDWPLAATIDKIMDNPNLLEREKALDRLSWDEIDRLNLFNYFTIEVILGYTLKLLILERWKNILQPEMRVEVSNIAEEKVMNHFMKSPLNK